MKLYISEAEKYVRTRLDELSFVPDDMITATPDDRNLLAVIKGLLPDAITRIHLAAPASLMEGSIIHGDDSNVMFRLKNKVIEVDFTESTVYVMRFVSFKAPDSDVLLTQTFFEDSPMAKLQNNRYMRGTPDSPVMVEMGASGRGDADERYSPVYRYYQSNIDEAHLADCRLVVFEVPRSRADETEEYYFISSRLEHAVLDALTGLVLQTYNRADAAAAFMQKADSALGITE